MAPPTTQYARFPDSLVLVALSTVADPLSERIVGDAVVTLSEEGDSSQCQRKRYCSGNACDIHRLIGQQPWEWESDSLRRSGAC